MYKFTTVFCFALLTGCSTAATDYYQAVEKTAQANAAAAQAKFDALSKIAAAGDGQAASAAVMALALTQTSTVAPVPQQSQALQWASILAAPISNLGMMWLQTDSTKAMAEYNRDVSLARISADATTQQSLYGAFTDQSALTADVALGGLNAMGNVDYTPFIDGMVDLGTAGINGAVDLGNAGLDSNVAISSAAITGLVDLGNAGLDSTVTMGTAGMNSAVTLGTEGMTGITNVSLAGYENMLNMDAANNNLFSSVWDDYQSAIQSILDAQVNCSAATNADGTASINCQ